MKSNEVDLPPILKGVVGYSVRVRHYASRILGLTNRCPGPFFAGGKLYHFTVMLYVDAALYPSFDASDLAKGSKNVLVDGQGAPGAVSMARYCFRSSSVSDRPAKRWACSIND